MIRSIEDVISFCLRVQCLFTIWKILRNFLWMSEGSSFSLFFKCYRVVCRPLWAVFATSQVHSGHLKQSKDVLKAFLFPWMNALPWCTSHFGVMHPAKNKQNKQHLEIQHCFPVSWFFCFEKLATTLGIWPWNSSNSLMAHQTTGHEGQQTFCVSTVTVAQFKSVGMRFACSKQNTHIFTSPAFTFHWT